MTRRRARTNWQMLTDEVETALRTCEGGFPTSVRIDGKLNRLETGLSHQNYWFRIKADGPLPRAGDTAYVLRSLRTKPDGMPYVETSARLEREALTLQALASHKFDFSVPRFVCFVRGVQTSVTGFIETGLPGVPLEYIKNNPGKRPFLVKTVARIASAVHRVPPDIFSFLPRQQDNSTQLQARLHAFCPEFIAQDADAAAVADWVRDRLTKDRQPVLLHGDLLPQNILWDWETDELGVVDWEFARIGDPAYDLAIVTRGHAKPFGCPKGLPRLVDAYCRASGMPIGAVDVVSHELLTVLRWLEESVRAEREERREGHPPSHWRNQIRAILRRAESLGAR